MKAAKAMDGSADFLRLALEVANVGLWDWDLQSNRVYLSPEWKRQLGYGEHELTDNVELWRSRVHPEDMERLTQEAAAYIRQSVPDRRFEYRLLHRDGGYRWIQSQAMLFKGRNGKTVRMLGANMDITARKQAELQANETQRRLTTLLDNLPGMVFRCATDSAWTLQYVSGHVQELTGYSAQQLLSETPAVSPQDLMHPEDIEWVRKEMRRAVEQKGSYTAEYRLIAAGGVEKWIWERGSVVLAADGTVEALDGFIQDITERKRAEQELRASEKLRRLIIDTGPECVKLVAADGRLLHMNPAGLAMLEADSLEQAQSHALTEYVAPEHRSAFADLHQRVIRGERGLLEFEVIGRRGTRRWLETHAVPLENDQGGTTLLGVTRDITERKQQQQRIERLSRMRGVMSNINALIVRTRSRAELFQEACRIAVEMGGFGMAWIGIVQGAELVPLALHGDDGGQVLKTRFSLDRNAANTCVPTSQAVHENHFQVCNDIAGEPLLGAWRETLGGLGYASFVAFPLAVNQQAVGSFNLYSTEPGFFDEDELKLLSELTGDISYALEFIIKDEQLDFLSIYDPLTRLPNRNLFMRRLPGFLQAAQDSGKRVALLMLDVERFKAINDAAGQAGGDELLKLAGERLKFHAGGPSFVARIAGDRFAALITDIDRSADVEQLVQKGNWDRLDPPFQHAGQDFSVTFKIGLAVFPQDAGDAEGMLRRAEQALKHGKAAGGRLTRYTADMGDAALRKLQMTRQLRRALEREEFVLHYQPKVDLRTGAVCGAEALLRWQSPELGVVAPGNIVPLMEETGLIVDVGRWVLEQAVRQRTQWLKEGLAVPRIGVNVSAVQLRESDFVRSVQGVLGKEPLASGLEIEITESTMMTNPDVTVATLRTLRDLGLTIAMDDYGTGYSSLAYLNRLPLNAVKIDRSFIITMANNPDTMNIVSSIIALAHSMNLKVVAEGVEAQEQLQYLRVLRCDEIQGYLFSKPLAPADFATLLRSGKKLD